VSEVEKEPFDALIREAESHPVGGWDFSWLGDRMETSPLPWDFKQIVDRHARQSPDLLDMGTGGGEWLASLPYRPPRTVATESWEPNVSVAANRLQPLGVDVLKVEPTPNNIDQLEQAASPRLPFANSSFHLVINRHESFVPSEIERVLTPGGRFLTQQIGDGIYADFCSLVGATPPKSKPWLLAEAIRQVEAAGLHVGDSAATDQTVTFRDVGALAWYLRMIPWTVRDFSIATYRERLADLHERTSRSDPLVARLKAFYLKARKLALLSE
jgi:SAM-dependent methyltransferase